MTTDTRPRAIIGVGREDRRDDGVGLVVARALTGERLPQDVETLEERAFGVSLAAELERFSAAVLVKAIRMGAEPGTVAVFSPDDLAEPQAAVLELSALSDYLSIGAMAFEAPRVWCIAVQPREIAPGTGLSLEVGHAVAEAVAKAKELLGG